MIAGKIGTRTVTGRCSECDASGFTSHHGIRGVVCMTCGTVKPESTPQIRQYEERGYAAMAKSRSFYLSECPYADGWQRDAWQAGAWRWCNEQRASKDLALRQQAREAT